MATDFPDSVDPDDPLGQTIRHEALERDFEPSHGDEQLMRAVCDHFTAHIGEAPSVYHEVISNLVHVDVHVVDPTESRPYYTLYTTGCAERPMSPPPQAAECRYIELMMKLPPHWEFNDNDHLSEDPFERRKAHNWIWPVNWLNYLARFPHEYGTWLWEGHTVPTADPPEPIADNTDCCCMFILSPAEPEEFRFVQAGHREVRIFGVVPIFEEEMDFKIQKGASALIDKFRKHKVSDVADPSRINVAKRRRFGLF